MSYLTIATMLTCTGRCSCVFCNGFKKPYLLEMEDAAFVSKDASAMVKLHQTVP
jgi:uncharacterized membrane protein